MKRGVRIGVDVGSTSARAGLFDRDGRMLGAFAAEINLAPVQAQLRLYLTDSTARAIYLVSDSGRVLASSREISEALLNKRMPPRRLEDMARRDTAATIARSPRHWVRRRERPSGGRAPCRRQAGAVLTWSGCSG